MTRPPLRSHQFQIFKARKEFRLNHVCPLRNSLASISNNGSGPKMDTDPEGLTWWRPRLNRDNSPSLNSNHSTAYFERRCLDDFEKQLFFHCRAFLLGLRQLLPLGGTSRGGGHRHEGQKRRHGKPRLQIPLIRAGHHGVSEVQLMTCVKVLPNLLTAPWVRVSWVMVSALVKTRGFWYCWAGENETIPKTNK